MAKIYVESSTPIFSNLSTKCSINLTTTVRVRNIHLKFEPQVRDMQINILILLLRAYKFEYF